MGLDILEKTRILLIFDSRTGNRNCGICTMTRILEKSEPTNKGQIFSYLEPQRYSGSNDRENRQSAVLLTKAGPITVLSNPYRQVYACVVPHNFHIHKHRTSFENVVGTQPQIEIVPGMERLKEKTFPVVSIVKGMTFSLIDLTDAPEVMAALRAGEAPAAKLDDEWDVGLVGCLYYQRRGMKEKEGEAAILEIHQRMITDGQEDPGTGSASCALGCYLALSMGLSKNDREGHELDEDKASQASAEITDRTKSMTISGKKEHHVFGIEQGVELGRKCQICVEVDITQDEEGQGSVGAVMLSGRCSFVTRGELLGTA